MKIEHYPDGEIRWLLSSGWRVNPSDSLYFVAPDGCIYDRCGSTLFSRCKSVPATVELMQIFTSSEFESYSQHFNII